MLRFMICLTCCCVSSVILAQDSAPSKQKTSDSVHLLSYRVVMLETTAKLDLKINNLTGGEALAQLLKMDSQNEAIHYYQSFAVTSVEQTRAQIQIGQSQSVIAGQSRSFSGRGGQPTRSSLFESRETGSLLSIQGRIHATGKIAVELNFNASRLEKQEPAPTDDEDDTPLPPKTLTLTSESTVILDEGVPQIVFQGTETRDGQRIHSLLIVTAEVKD